MTTVRWGILSTARIARVLLEASRRTSSSEFVAVASRDEARAARFAVEMQLPASYGSYEALLASDDVDAVYIPLPISMHKEWTIKALQAGKHVLCEKAFATSPEDASACFDAAEAVGRTCTEALMWRLHPQTALVRRLLADGAVGELCTIRAALSVTAAPGDIRRRPEVGGGATFDLGAYCVSALRLFGGSPQRVYAERLDDGPAGVDLRMVATLRMPENVLGLFDIGLDLTRRDELELIGTTGRITVTDPWICNHKEIAVVRDGVSEQVAIDPDGELGLAFDGLDPYVCELEAVSATVLGEREPDFGRDDAVEQALILSLLLRSGQDGVSIDVRTGQRGVEVLG